MNKINDEINELIIRYNRVKELKNTFLEGVPDNGTEENTLLINNAINVTNDMLKELEGTIKLYIKCKDNLSITAPGFNETFRTVLEKIITEIEINSSNGNDKNDIETLKAIIPRNTVLDNTKVTRSMTRVALNDKNIKMEVAVGNKQSREDCVVIVNIEDNNDIAIKGGKFTAIDQANLRAVHDLFEAGNKYFSLESIYRARRGLDKTEKVSPQAVARLRDSIDKMSNLKITIDYTEQYKLWYPDKNIKDAQFKKEEPLLPIGKAIVKVSGVEKQVYYLLKEPLLYEYAKTFNQVITLPARYLNTKDVICRSSGDEDDVIIQYLLNRIAVMKNSKGKISNKIAYRRYDEKENRYKGIFVELGFNEEPPSKQKADKLRERIKDILTSFVNKGFITGYKDYKEKGSKAFAGIEIFY